MRITDFPELVTATGNDLLVTVDIANDLTKKIKLENLPTSIATTVALATKQNLLVSGTNIKTLNSVSLLGSGDIVLAATPSGVAGAIQFSNGSAFASDATNLFWDDTNNYLGIGTNTPTSNFDVKSTATSFVFAKFLANNGNEILTIRNNSNNLGNILAQNVTAFSIGTNQTTARLNVQGSGSTSATTALLVQNSAGTAALTVTDDRVVSFGNYIQLNNGDLIVPSNNSGALELRPGASSGRVLLNGATAINITSAMPNASAMLDITSTTKGFLPPRMTTTQKNAIATPAAGLVVYDNTTNKLCCYNGSTWNDLF